MKFAAVVGNPPYQETTENTSDKPIYNYFMDIAFKISDKVTFITPARFLFNAGKTPKDWNLKILNDEHFKVVWYKSNSTDVFPNVDIKGGVAVTFRDANQKFGKIVSYTSHPELDTICKKVEMHKNFEPLSKIIHLQNKFNLSNLFALNKKYKEQIGSNGKERRLTTPIFEQLDIFKDSPQNETDLKILGLIKNKRVFKWAPIKVLDEHPNTFLYKVLLPAANGTGKLGEVLSTPLVCGPNVGFTFSFISFGAYKNQLHAEFLLKYIKSKFCRTLLGVLKVTQHNLPNTWQKIPIQDFTENSDIDWSKSIPEIDKQLYAKYGLTQEESGFIESMIKPMI